MYDINIADPDKVNTGLRQALLYLMPNWKYSVKISYKFETPISFTRRKHEQRKALQSRPTRVQEYKVSTNTQAALIWHYLAYLRYRRIWLPLFNEPCLPVEQGNLLGVSSIECSNDLPNYYSLNNNTEYVIVIDRREQLDLEILVLTNVINYTINTGAGIGGNMLGATTVLYPLFPCYLNSFNKKNLNDRTALFSLEFMEYFD